MTIQSANLDDFDIKDQLTLNVYYPEKPILLNRFYEYQEQFYSLITKYKDLKRYNYHSRKLAKILSDLESLKEKNLKSKNEEMGFTRFGETRDEFLKLIDLSKSFSQINSFKIQ